MLFDHTRIPPQTINSSHMLLTRKLCWLIVMKLSNEKNGETVRQHLLEIINVLKVLTFQGTCETRVTSQATLKLLRTAHCPCLSPGRHCRTTPMCQRHPASTAMQTQPLSNCVLRACAYQRTRERNTGIAKTKYCRGFWRLFGKGRMFGRPFFKTNPQELSTLWIYPENSWTKQRRRQSTKHCLSQMLPTIFILQLRRNIPLTNMTSIMFCFSKHAMERKCINSHTVSYRTWRGMILEGISLNNFWNLYML